MSSMEGARPRRLSRIVRLLLLLVLFLLLLPYLLPPLYLTVQPISTPMLWRYATGQRVERLYRPIEAIAPVLRRTVIASEDARYCDHRGIDWRGLRELLEDAED